ncbi:MAG: hypothetical protein J1E40_04650 [Oscillospiraceae bacterium]|nr:hypothetical protein [Oscillospiraceae bacterium]
MKQKILDSFKKGYGILIALLVISVLTYILIFMSNNAVFFDVYDGLYYYNIKDTTTAMCKDYPSVEEIFYVNSQVKRLKNLQSLQLYIKSGDSLKFLKDFSALEKLDLDALGCSGTAALDTIPAMPDLKYIYLSFFEKDGLDFSPLRQFTALEDFCTYDCNIHDWSFVEDLPKLRNIHYISSQPKEDVNWMPLGSAESLEEFTASIIYYDRSLIDILEKLSSLNKVYLKFYGLEDLPEADREYIYDWIGRMKEKGISVQVYNITPDISLQVVDITGISNYVKKGEN